MASIPVNATAQTGSQITGSTSTAGLRPQDRTFSLTGTMGATIVRGDIVAIWGSNDGGRTFQPLRTAINEQVLLTLDNPECVIDDACDTYATQRVGVGPGSALAAVGFNGETVFVNPSPAWVQGGNAGFGPLGILGTTDTAPFRIIAEGIDIFDSTGVVTALGNPESVVAGSSLQLSAGAGSGQFAVTGGGSLDIQTDTGLLGVTSTGADIVIRPGVANAIDLTPRAAGAGNTTPLRFFELAANGTNYIGFRAADSIAASLNYVLWSADAAGAISSDGAGTLSIVPPVKATFSAAASLTNAAAQFVPPSGLATDVALNYGVLQANAGTISKASFRWTGDAANVAGQTATMILLKNGVAIAGATSGAQPTTAGSQGADVTFAPVALVIGDVITSTFTPSAILTAVCTKVMGAGA